MKVVVLLDKEKVGEKSASIIYREINKNPELVLGLATGSTVIPLYRNLVKLNKQGKVSFSRVITFNLDEYVGLSKKNKNSYRFFMEKNLFSKIDINKNNIHFLDGTVKDFKKESERYEREIKKVGGIDFQILGIGRNDHIGFNEPGSSFKSKTRKIELSPDTRKANLRFFSSINKVPKSALTMGIGTIMKSKKILLLSTGKHKSKAIGNALKHSVSEEFPASVLRKHRDVTFILDKSSATRVK